MHWLGSIPAGLFACYLVWSVSKLLRLSHRKSVLTRRLFSRNGRVKRDGNANVRGKHAAARRRMGSSTD